MNLRKYSETYGASAALSKDMGVTAVMISQWANKVRPVPDDRAAAIEWHTDFVVTVEEMCPATRWVRVPHPLWPNGKPLIDKTPEIDIPRPFLARFKRLAKS